MSTDFTEKEIAENLVKWAKSFVTRAEKRLAEINVDLTEAGVQLRINSAVEAERNKYDDWAGGFGPPSAQQLYNREVETINKQIKEARENLKHNKDNLAFVEKICAPYL
jgi:hypothetical protein